MADGKLYFAYGSNINLDQMAYRCPDAKVVGPVTLEGWELLFWGSGVATIGPKEGSTVHGLLWRLTPDCERSLDHYEGFPHLYGKKSVSVTDKSGQTASVMAYIMTERYRAPAVPPAPYYQGIRKGYRQNGLPVAALKKAWEHAVREVHEYTMQVNDRASKQHGRRKRHER